MSAEVGAAGTSVEGAVESLRVTITAPVASFRNPLYAGVQVCLPCPPPATIGGALAAAAGGWEHVEEGLRFAAAFTAGGRGVDLETFHPLDGAGGRADPVPKDREFLAEVTLTLWLIDDLDAWQFRLRRPVWPMRLGRSQDLAGVRTARVTLRPGSGRHGHALLPATASKAGTLLQLPCAVSRDRSRTRWDAFRYQTGRVGTDNHVDASAGGWIDEDGQAVVPLTGVHPVHAEQLAPP